MLLNQDGLHMKVREVCTHHRQEFRLIEEDLMVGIGKHVLRQGRLLQLPQSAVAVMFIHASADTMLRGSDVNLAT